jgi:hypothetical protein
MIITDQTRLSKEIFQITPEVKRNAGRPRYRWLEDLENDLG